MREQGDKLTGEVRALAERFQFAVEFTPTGVVTVPLLEPDKPMTEETFRLLPDEKQAALRAKMQEIMHSAEDVLPEVQRLQSEFHEQQHALDREVVGFTVGHPRSPSERTTRVPCQRADDARSVGWCAGGRRAQSHLLQPGGPRGFQSVNAMVTVFRLIRPGALHRANGGYLILQARDADPSRWADGRDEADVTATNGRLILHAVS